MTWLAERTNGSIGGIPFRWTGIEYRSGRRGANRQFYGRDGGRRDDFGRAQKHFAVVGFYAGDDYLDERDALEALLDSGKTMTLISPWRRECEVRLDGEYTASERSDGQGFIEYSIPLVEHTDEDLLVVPETGAKLRKLADAVDASVVIDGKVKIRKPELLKDALRRVGQLLSNVNDALRKAKGAVASRMNLVDNLANQLDAFSRNIDALLEMPGQLLADLIAIVQTIVGLVDKVDRIKAPSEQLAEFADVGEALAAATETQATPAAAAASAAGAVRREGTSIPTQAARVDALMAATRLLCAPTVGAGAVVAFDPDRAAGSVEDPAAEPTTPSRVIERDARYAIDFATKLATVAAVSRVLSRIEFPSSTMAAATLSELTAVIDAVLESPILSDDLFTTVSALKAGLVDHVRSTAANLPRVSTWTPPSTMPALVVAYQVHGDAFRDQEICAANPIPNPLFVQPEPLEVVL